jgi:hypothetical protein
MRVIEDLLDYVERGVVSEELSGAKDQIGQERLRVVTIMILHWLKCEKGPLSLNMSYPWCVELLALMRLDSRLSSLFVASGLSLDFREDIGNDTREMIRSTVDLRYKPSFRISTPLTKCP